MREAHLQMENQARAQSDVRGEDWIFRRVSLTQTVNLSVLTLQLLPEAGFGSKPGVHKKKKERKGKEEEKSSREKTKKEDTVL